MKNILIVAFILLASCGTYNQSVIRLDQMDFSKATVDFTEANASIGLYGDRKIEANKNVKVKPMSMAGKSYKNGVGFIASGFIYVITNGATEFTARAGIDDESGQKRGSAVFQIIGDNKVVLWTSPEMHCGDSARTVKISIGKNKTLTLSVLTQNEKNRPFVDWVDAVFTFSGKPPETVQQFKPFILCRRIHFVKTGNPYLLRFGSTGPDTKFTVSGLPPECKYDELRRSVSGYGDVAKKIPFKIKAVNEYGSDSLDCVISIQDSLLFPTPPMGWMSWIFYGETLHDSLFRKQANALVASGLDKLGYKYLYLDDGWQAPKRDKNGNIQTNTAFFPYGMKSLVDFVHSKGLKMGIYSDPAEKTCAGALGSLGYEEKDAASYAAWGCDLLKYDYCGAPQSVDSAISRYARMSNALRKSGRQIAFYACEWGLRRPWLWAAEKVNASFWRSDGDSRDGWTAAFGAGIYEEINHSPGTEYYSGPGRWNDLDELVAGLYGKTGIGNITVTQKAGQTEYNTQFGMFCLLASTLTLTNDLTNMDEATRELITNKELIDINQDVLGDQASRIINIYRKEVWVKQLTDNRLAVGLLNADDSLTQSIKVDWNALQISGSYNIRDVFAHVDLPQSSSEYFAVGLKPHELRLIVLKPSSAVVQPVQKNK